MKKSFLTGIVILLPVALTFAIITFVINFLTKPFLGAVKSLFQKFDLFNKGFFFLTAHELQTVIAQLLIILLLVATTLLLGFIARWFFFHTLIKGINYLVHKIPFVNTIYKTSQDVISTIFTTKTNSFKQVVLVPFPGADSLSIGLITRESLPGISRSTDENHIAVFVPTTPNPTSGFLLIYKESDIIYLNIKVEEAFKYVISCGLITPDSFHAVSKNEAQLFAAVNNEIVTNNHTNGSEDQ